MHVKYDKFTKIVFQVVDGRLSEGVATALHNAMYEYANINAISLWVDIRPEEFGEFIKAAKTLHADGFDIGVPHKSAIIDYLDECDPASRAFRCVNFVKIREDGTMYGKGLDGIGMGQALEKAYGSMKGKRILILGGGAVAGLIPADLCERGAAKVTVANRTVDKAKYIADTLTALYGVQTEYGPLEAEYLARVAPEVDVVVQCTTLGGHGEDFADLSFMSCLPKQCVAADVLYPETSFLRAAREAGLKTMNGEPMLYEQQLAMMKERFGVELPEDALRCGEQTVAAAIAERMVRDRYLKK